MISAVTLIATFFVVDTKYYGVFQEEAKREIFFTPHTAIQSSPLAANMDSEATGQVQQAFRDRTSTALWISGNGSEAEETLAEIVFYFMMQTLHV